MVLNVSVSHVILHFIHESPTMLLIFTVMLKSLHKEVPLLHNPPPLTPAVPLPVFDFNLSHYPSFSIWKQGLAIDDRLPRTAICDSETFKNLTGRPEHDKLALL
jgi:hypothetical protein